VHTVCDDRRQNERGRSEPGPDARAAGCLMRSIAGNSSGGTLLIDNFRMNESRPSEWNRRDWLLRRQAEQKKGKSWFAAWPID
jgi:hypothetical protein